MNVRLTPQLEAVIQQKVASGRYTSASEVVREALQLLDEREQFHRLKAAIDVGRAEIARGEGVPWSLTSMAELSREADEEDQRGLPLDDDHYP